MAVFRIEKTRDYTVMANHHLRNTALSLKAKGLLSLMLSLPEDWDYTTKGLARICRDGVDSICATVRELEDAGYIIPARDDDGQAVFFAQPVAGPAYLVIAALVGMVVLVVGEADRIENQVIMDVILVNVSGEDKFIFAAQDLPCQFHADPVGFLWHDLPRFKGLDQVTAQVCALVDGMAACPFKFNVGGLGGAAEGGHQQLPVRLVRIADIVNRSFQR